ncbi:unnamed protein product [Calypogeia fissa]
MEMRSLFKVPHNCTPNPNPEIEKFADIKLKSYTVAKHYYTEKGYAKCPDCPKLLHCSFCVQHLRNLNPHHWVGITVNEVPGCRGCQDRYQRGIAEAKNETNWLRKKLNILEMRLTSHSEDLREAHEIADIKLSSQQVAYDGVESVMEMDLRAQIEDLSKGNDDAESILGMKVRLELEKMREKYEGAESRVAFLKRRPPDAAMPGGGLGSTLPPLGDVTFVVQGQNIFAHQLILGYTSRVFQKMFEEEMSKLLQKIPEPVKEVEIVTIPLPPPRLELPPPPPRPPELPRTPPPTPPPELSPPPPPPRPPAPQIILPPQPWPEIPPPKRPEKIPPMVNVKLARSAMLEQMGLRGVRLQLTVAPGQLLVDDATSQTCNNPELMQETTSTVRNGAKTGIKRLDSKPEVNLAGTSSDLTISVSALFQQAESSKENKLSEEPLKNISLLTKSLPIVQSEQAEPNIENKQSEEPLKSVALVTTTPNVQSQPEAEPEENKLSEESLKNVALLTTPPMQSQPEPEPKEKQPSESEPLNNIASVTTLSTVQSQEAEPKENKLSQSEPLKNVAVPALPTLRSQFAEPSKENNLLSEGRLKSIALMTTVPIVQPQEAEPQGNKLSEEPLQNINIKLVTALPMLQSQKAEPNLEDKLITSDEPLKNVALVPFNNQVGPTAKTVDLVKTMQTARSIGLQPTIQLDDTSYAVMKAVVNCCYTADIDFTEEVSPGEVLKVAHKYEIDYLQDLCEKELCRTLNAKNVGEMLKLGRKFGAKELHSQATQFFKENFDDVYESVLYNCC